MFLTRMVNGLFNTNKNANDQQQQQQQKQQHQQPTNKSSKANKKTDKSNNLSGNSNNNNNNNNNNINNNNNNNKKRSILKSESKKCMNNLLLKSYNTDNVKDNQACCSSKTQNFNISNNNNNNNNNSNNSGNVTATPTKVKSGSWKRSEKQVTNLNTLTNKKSKNSRKHSPTWLQFNNMGLKTVATTNIPDVASVCRPGTLYSDVVFSAGSSCLVKVKTLTPLRVTNATPKKLTIALLKCSRPDKEGSENRDIEVMKEREHDKKHEREPVDLFPKLPDSSLKKSKCTTSAPPSSRSGLNSSKISSTASKTTKNSHPDIMSSPRKKNTSSHRKNNILIVKDLNGLVRNGTKLSFGNYLEQRINRNYSNGLDAASSNKKNVTKSTTRKPFTIDIPAWNRIDVSGELYPKFLCQFDDEHYLRAETAALLGLKLALGNSAQQGKFKFFN